MDAVQQEQQQQEEGADPCSGAEWDMSAPISAEDLAKAGGLGARDDISSPVPVAADNTDLEETLMEFGAQPGNHEGVGYHGQEGGEVSGDALGVDGKILGSTEGEVDDPQFLEHHFTQGTVEPTE